jgi:serine/threonine protein kinase
VLCIGPYVGFSGSAWTSGTLQVDPLTPILPLAWEQHDNAMKLMAARYFAACVKAARALENYYRTELSTARNLKSFTLEFPCYTTYEDDREKITVRFRYSRRPWNFTLVYFGITEAGDEVFIKFTRTYSRKAHLICEELGAAPRLRSCQTLPGGWMMIVMDFIDNSMFERYSERYGSEFAESDILQPRVERVVKALHNEGLVHGDLRDTNLLVGKNGKEDVLLIDFDWAGMEGEVRYPINIASGPHLWRPDGAVGGELITKEHDLAMLDKIFT